MSVLKKKLLFFHKKHSAGPGCSKLKMSIVNQALYFERVIITSLPFFAANKSRSRVLSQNIPTLNFACAKRVNVFKVTMLWTTGSRAIAY